MIDIERLIVKMQFGSHVYGTNIATSDYDIKCVVLPPLKDIILQRVCDSRSESTKQDRSLPNSPNDIDTEIFSLQKYMNLLLQGQTVALDMLFTPKSFFLETETICWEFIRENKNKFLHSGTASFAGYCKQQANKYGIKGSRVSAVKNIVNFLHVSASKYSELARLCDFWDEVIFFTLDKEFISIAERKSSDGQIVDHLECCNRLVPKFLTIKGALAIYQRLLDAYGERSRQAESNQNVDWKALMHAVRVCEQAKELLTTGNITFPRPEAELLLKIRKGELPYKQVAELIENGLAELNEAQRNSILPKEPDYNFAEEIVFKFYKQRFCKTA